VSCNLVSDVPHLSIFNKIAGIPLMYYNSVDNWLNLVEGIKNNTLIVSVSVLLELVTCCSQGKSVGSIRASGAPGVKLDTPSPLLALLVLRHLPRLYLGDINRHDLPYLSKKTTALCLNNVLQSAHIFGPGLRSGENLSPHSTFPFHGSSATYLNIYHHSKACPNMPRP
jgi:hypothetical protein